MYIDMYTEIHVDIYYFNRDTMQRSVSCKNKQSHQ